MEPSLKNLDTPPMISSSICLLDDNLSVLRATRRLLNSAGWEAESFHDPIAFVSHIQAHQPPVAVIDMLMPLMNGLEVQSRIHHVSPSTRVIILTSTDDPAIETNAIAAGAFGFFRKPVEPERFLEKVAAALNGQ